MAKPHGMFTGSVEKTSQGYPIESRQNVDTAYALSVYAEREGLAPAETADLLQMMGLDAEPLVAAALVRHGLVEAPEPLAIG